MLTEKKKAFVKNVKRDAKGHWSANLVVNGYWMRRVYATRSLARNSTAETPFLMDAGGYSAE